MTHESWNALADLLTAPFTLVLIALAAGAVLADWWHSKN